MCVGYYEYNNRRGIWQLISKQYDNHVKYALNKGKWVMFHLGYLPYQSPSLYFDAQVK